jgi:hypothetical protein
VDAAGERVVGQAAHLAWLRAWAARVCTVVEALG